MVADVVAMLLPPILPLPAVLDAAGQILSVVTATAVASSFPALARVAAAVAPTIAALRNVATAISATFATLTNISTSVAAAAIANSAAITNSAAIADSAAIAAGTRSVAARPARWQAGDLVSAWSAARAP
jgi:hypothetical protein